MLRSASDPLTPGASAVERFRADLARLIDIEHDRVVIALSGGGDSVALLLLARAALGSRCMAATVDHGLRQDSAAEAAWAGALCDRLGVTHRTLTGELPARVARTANLSARARSFRYTLLERHLAQTGARWLVTAHHADDQLETIIMRLNRGAGVAGLAGIRPKGGRVVRPLLGWRRAELAGIVAAAGVDAVDDPSNRDDRFDRARLRKALGEAGWIDPERWSRSATALGDAQDALEWATRQFAERCVADESDGIRLHLDGHPVELVRRLVLHCLTRIDPMIDPRGDAVMRAVAMIAATERDTPGHHPRMTLGTVLIATHFHARTGLSVTFSPAPPRRAP